MVIMKLNSELLMQNPCDEDLDTQILKLLEAQALSVDTISFITNTPSYKVCQRLEKLNRWKRVKLVTSRQVGYWTKR